MRGLEAARNLLLAFALAGAPAAAAEDSPVREMMVISGLVEQFADLGEITRTGVLQSMAAQPSLPAELGVGLADIAARAMDPDAFLADLEAELAITLAPDEIAAVTEFYRSPLGERLARAEAAASTSEARAEIEASRAELQAELASHPKRQALAFELDDALLASQLGATIAVGVGRAVALGMLRSQPQVPEEALAAVEQRLSSLHGMVVEQLREQLATTFAWTYRDFSDDELGEYVAFLKSEKARAVYAGFYAAFDGIYKERGERIGEEFGALIRQKKT